MWSVQEQDQTSGQARPPSYRDVQVSSEQDNAGPSLSILFQIVATREDIEPFLLVASELKRGGHRIRVATFKESQDLVEGYNLEFFDVGVNAAEVLCHTLTTATLSLPVNNNERQRRRALQSMLELCWLACINPGPCPDPGSEATGHRLGGERPFVTDVIVANPLAFAHVHCAEKLGVPLHIIPTYIWTLSSSTSSS